MVVSDPTRFLLDATGRSSLREALDWIAADHPLAKELDPHLLLQAIVSFGSTDQAALNAIRRLTRAVTSSELDTAAVIFEPETIAKPDEFQIALDLVAGKSAGHSLANVTESAVVAAQRENPFTIEALCAIAGLAYSDLVARAPVGLPAHPRDHWLAPQVRAAFGVVDRVIQDRVAVSVPDAQAARPLELMPAIAGPQASNGWDVVEGMRRRGVPYAVLLAQRAAGGAWLAHRNRTSGKVAHSIAGQLCSALSQRGLDYRRSRSVGGNITPAHIHELSGAGKQVGIVAVDNRRQPTCGVIFSVARDSGTASKNAGRLRTMPRATDLPLLLALAGRGWAARNDTADLAIAFQGRVYAERDVDLIADEIAKMTTMAS